MVDQSPSNPPRETNPPDAAPRRRRFSSEELLDGQTEILIEHRGDTYRLRCTRQGKLILYK